MRHASCEGVVERTPISNTSLLRFKWSYSNNMNWGTVWSSRSTLLICSIRALRGGRGVDRGGRVEDRGGSRKGEGSGEREEEERGGGREG